MYGPIPSLSGPPAASTPQASDRYTLVFHSDGCGRRWCWCSRRALLVEVIGLVAMIAAATDAVVIIVLVLSSWEGIGLIAMAADAARAVAVVG